MEFRDLKTQYRNNKNSIDKVISQALADASFIGGKPVKELESILSDYVGREHCITCGNGTDALLLALMALGIKEGDAVFVPDFTFFSTAEIVPWVGATPVFVDVRKDTFNIDCAELEKEIAYVRENTILVPKAVIAVDLFGQPAEFDKIRKIAKDNNMYVIEDAAQGFGGSIGMKKACSFGDISTTSFFPAKPLGCYGDGGAVFTDNSEWAKKIRSLCVHGKGEDKYDNIRIGMNSRLDTLQAAVLKEKFRIFKEYELEKCNEVAQTYTKLLSAKVTTPMVEQEMTSSWAQYTIQLPSREVRDRVEKELIQEKVPCAVYYKKPLHLQRAFENSQIKGRGYPVTCQLCDSVLSLPMHAYLSEEDMAKICGIIERVV